ncbi:hypothetical protein DL96DRAFT_1590228 [Flagelloscypha sp. PMI_526]|nr:hypothetical protein DL96DRAFT_1590228 [Flagelloscypha sp. PMI_526]
MALMDLQCNQGNFTLLLNPDEKRYELPGHCAARFSNTHVAVFCRILGGFCRQVLIYPLQQSTRDTIWPAASLPLPAGTNNFVFSHITTPDLIFTILLTYSHHRLERFPDRQEGELHTAFTFSFDPSTANATFVEHSDEFSQNVVHDRYSIPQLSRSGHTLLHWGFGGEIKSEHLRLGGERKSSVLLKGSRSLKRGSFAGNIILDVDDRKGLVAWWWGGAPCSPVTMIKYGYCEKL